MTELDRPALGAIVLVGVAALEISRIPTFSLKKLHIRPSMALPLFMLVVVIAAGLASEPFLTFIVAGVCYLASIPVSVWMQARAKRQTPPVPASTPALPPGGGERAPSTSPYPDTSTS